MSRIGNYSAIGYPVSMEAVSYTGTAGTTAAGVGAHIQRSPEQDRSKGQRFVVFAENGEHHHRDHRQRQAHDQHQHGAGSH